MLGCRSEALDLGLCPQVLTLPLGLLQTHRPRPGSGEEQDSAWLCGTNAKERGVGEGPA